MIQDKQFICTIETFDVKWQVYIIDRDDPILNNSMRYSGLTVSNEHKIYIENGLDNIGLKEVVYHEVTHAFNNSLNNRKQEFTHEEVCDFVGRYGRNIYGQAEWVLRSVAAAMGDRP